MCKLREYILCDKSVKAFLTDARDNKLSHAYMVCSTDSDAVDTAINTMLKAVMCKEHGCNNCDICLRIDNGNHTDAHIYEEYSVEIAKEIIQSTYTIPSENGYAVFALKNFDNVSLAVQNKLLKTIEEPSRNHIIIIGTTNESSILKTIISRVKKLTINPWNRERVRDSLMLDGYGEEDAEFASALIPNSYNRASALLADTDVRHEYDRLIYMIDNLNNSSEIPLFLDCLSEKPEHGLDLLSSIFITMLKKSINGEGQKYNVAAITNIIERIADAKAQLKVNVTPSNLTHSLLMDMLEIRYKTR